jgi:hypothetical protein
VSWTTSTDDLRKLLSDGPTDKYFYRKKVFGDINGTNKNFKTFEFRRVTNFVTEPGGTFLGVYVNSTKVTATADDYATGEFTLTTAPVDGSRVEATYYAQWFLDSELDEFLTTGSQWLGRGSTVSNIEDGLQPAVLKYASGEAYQKLSLRWVQHMSETYRLEDAVDPKTNQIVDPYDKASIAFKKEAEVLRDDFYKRQGQYLSPLNKSLAGRVREIAPKR